VESTRPGVIPEISEPTSPEEQDSEAAANDEDGPSSGSALTNLFRSKKRPVPSSHFSTRPKDSQPKGSRSNGHEVPEIRVDDGDTDEEPESEHTALLGSSQSRSHRQYKSIDYLERQWVSSKGRWSRMGSSVRSNWESVQHPSRWDYNNMIKASAGSLSAVFLGVLLNLLDALSYGMMNVSTSKSNR
jgi:SulP family sulfate permease